MTGTDIAAAREWFGCHERFGPLSEVQKGEVNKMALFLARHRHSATAELAEALKPFAALAELWTSCEQHPSGCPDSALVGEVVDLTVGDFRRARQALTRAGATS
jgi:hypothetical protein